VTISVHICPRLRISYCLYRADLVSDLHVRLLGWVRCVESLIVREAIQVLVVLIIHFQVVFAIRISLEIVEQAE
jgi:hypothetical protein